MKEVDIEFAWDNLYAFNKQIIDPVANRYFFVWDPVGVDIVGVDRLSSRSPLHPDHPERGTRDHVLVPPIEVYMTREDLEGFQQRGTVRLKDLCNLRWEDGKGVYTGNDHGVLREGVRISHWAPPDGIEAEVFMPDGVVRRGVAERLPASEMGKVVQFERFGFARVVSTPPRLQAYFTQ
jgi:glutamyl-tRNA synthetase